MSPGPVIYKATAELMVNTIDAGTKPYLRVTSVPVQIEKRLLLTVQRSRCSAEAEEPALREGQTPSAWMA
jgi:hypothetical protein